MQRFIEAPESCANVDSLCEGGRDTHELIGHIHLEEDPVDGVEDRRADAKAATQCATLTLTPRSHRQRDHLDVLEG